MRFIGYFKRRQRALKASALALVLCACSAATDSDFGGEGGGFSLSEINVNLPKQSQFPANSAQVTGYNIKIEPSDCSGGTRVDRSASLANSRVSQGLERGCNYYLSFSLGNLDENESSLAAVYYQTPERVVITRQQLQDNRVSVSLSMRLTEAGRQAGLPERPGESGGQQQGGEQQGGEQQQEQQGNQDSIPPQQNQVGERFNVAVTNADGQSVRLSELVRGELVMVDFSSDTCGPCFSFARTLRGNERLKSVLSSGKCSKITYVRGSMETWQSRVGAGDFSSTVVTPRLSDWQPSLQKLIGTASVGTPHVAIFRRDGTLVERGSQALLNRFIQECSAL